MGIKHLSGELKPAMPVYFPGWQVTGVVHIELDSTTSIRRVLVNLDGKGVVKWSEGGGESKTTYKSSQAYVQQEVIAWQGAETEGKMQAGVYELPFSFTLPHILPSSFEGPHGHVRYTIESRADREYRLDTTHSFGISVCTLYDLNTDPRARIPCSIEKSGSACCLCCASGPVHVTLYSERSGYVPGETMIVNGEVHNKSSSDVKSTHLDILQVIVYKSGTKSKEISRRVQSVVRGEIERGRSMAWDNVQLGIPFVSPTNLDYCDIMKVSYIVKFSAKFGVCRAVSKQQPIIIGSIPLSAEPGSQPNMQAAPMPTSSQLCGVCGMGGEPTVSHSGTGACNGQGRYEGLTLHVAPSLFQRPRNRIIVLRNLDQDQVNVSSTGELKKTLLLLQVNVVYASQPARSSYF